MIFIPTYFLSRKSSALDCIQIQRIIMSAIIINAILIRIEKELTALRFAYSWEQRKFNDVFSILQNCTLSRAELSYDNGEAFNIHYGDVLIKFGEVIDAETAILPRITDDKIVASFRSSALQDGDIVIADTAEDEAVGKCAEMLNLQEKTAISGLHTIPVRPTARFATGYLGYFMNSPAFHDQLLPLMQGTKVTSVSKSALQDTVISFPSERAEQGQIGRYFMALDTLITLHQREHATGDNVRSAQRRQGPHNQINILIFQFMNNVKIRFLCGRHTGMAKSPGYTSN